MEKLWILWEGKPKQVEMYMAYDNNEDGWGHYRCPELGNKQFDYLGCPKKLKTYKSLMALVAECNLYDY